MIKLFKRFWKWLRKTKTRTLSLFFAFVAMFVFITAVLMICNNGGTVPDSLIWCVFAVLFLVILMSGVIAVTDIRFGDVELHIKSRDDLPESGEPPDAD